MFPSVCCEWVKYRTRPYDGEPRTVDTNRCTLRVSKHAFMRILTEARLGTFSAGVEPCYASGSISSPIMVFLSLTV